MIDGNDVYIFRFINGLDIIGEHCQASERLLFARPLYIKRARMIIYQQKTQGVFNLVFEQLCRVPAIVGEPAEIAVFNIDHVLTMFTPAPNILAGYFKVTSGIIVPPTSLTAA